MNLGILKQRLLERLRQKVRNGEWTERALARRSGLSQPHLHHVLKGMRDLTTANADRLMEAGGIQLFDLIAPEELAAHLERRDLEPEWDQLRRLPTS